MTLKYVPKTNNDLEEFEEYLRFNNAGLMKQKDCKSAEMAN